MKFQFFPFFFLGKRSMRKNNNQYIISVAVLLNIDNFDVYGIHDNFRIHLLANYIVHVCSLDQIIEQ